MNKNFNFERWIPPTVNEAALRTAWMRRKKRKLLHLVSGITAFHFLLAMVMTLHVAKVDVINGFWGFCCIGGILLLFAGATILLLCKRRDYFYD